MSEEKLKRFTHYFNLLSEPEKTDILSFMETMIKARAIRERRHHATLL